MTAGNTTADSIGSDSSAAATCNTDSTTTLQAEMKPFAVEITHDGDDIDDDDDTAVNASIDAVNIYMTLPAAIEMATTSKSSKLGRAPSRQKSVLSSWTITDFDADPELTSNDIKIANIQLHTVSRQSRPAKKTVGLMQIFRYAKLFDWVLMIIGSLAAVIHGLGYPLSAIVLGRQVDKFMDPAQYCSVMQDVANMSAVVAATDSLSRLYLGRSIQSILSDPSCPQNLVNATLGSNRNYNDNPSVAMALQERSEAALNITMLLNATGQIDAVCASTVHLYSIRDTFLNDVTESAIWLAIIGIVILIATYAQNVCWALTASRQVLAIRIAFFESIMRHDIPWYDRQDTGALSSTYSDGILNIEKGIGIKFGVILQNLSCFVCGVIVAIVTGWKLGLVVLSFTPLVGLANFFTTKFVYSSANRESRAYAQASSIAQQAFIAIRTVAAFGGQRREIKQFEASLEPARKANSRKGLLMGLSMGIAALLEYVAYCLGYNVGVILIANEGYTIGQVFTIFFSLLMASILTGMATNSVEAFINAKAASFQVFQIIDKVTKMDALVSAKDRINVDPLALRGNIEMSKLDFTYPCRPGVKILDNVTISIKAGQTVALVGSSGCGKSTIVQLLQRFYDPDGGIVLVDGIDLRQLNLDSYRSVVGVVSQEPNLFATTIAENIRYGNPSATHVEIEEAAKLANAHDFIVTLPKGYATLVGEQGAQLSGGQKQRIAIARALVRNPRILLLDEATSALDSESEVIVQDALDKARSGRTTIVVAHRLSTIISADNIVVLDNGCIAEQGTHAELLSKGGLYAQLAKQQCSSDGGDSEISDVSTARRALLGSKRNRCANRSLRRTKPNDDGDISAIISADSKEEVDEAAVEKRRRKGKSRKEIAQQNEQIVKDHYSFVRLWRLALPEWHIYLIGAIGALLAGGLRPAFGIAFAKVLFAYTNCDSSQREVIARNYSLSFLAYGGISLLAFTLLHWLFRVAGESLVKRIRVMSFSAMLRQEMAWFDDEENPPGALVSRLARQGARVKDAAGTHLSLMTQMAASAIVSFAVGFAYEWRVTLIMVAFFPLLGLGQLYSMKISGDNLTNDRYLDQSAGILAQATTNFRTVTSLGVGVIDILLAVFIEPLKRRRCREILQANIAAILLGVGDGALLISEAVTVYAGAHFITEGLSNAEQMFTAFMAIMFLGVTLGQLSATAPDAKSATLAVAQLFQLMDRKPNIVLNDGVLNDSRGKSAAEFVDVTFAYPTRPASNVLHDFNLKIDSGQTIALVGASGCGKSTVIQLLERFYDPTSGEVKLDGTGLTQLSLPWIRARMSLVSQEPILFDRTIGENIAYGAPDDPTTGEPATVSQTDIEKAAKMAAAHGFISALPSGYHTRVGERGAQLSGGQKQRIAIARALIRRPQLLLLDEATSALDSRSESLVQAALDKAREGRTVLVIAHRLSTIENADVIAVVQAGKVVELGSHADLMARRGFYYAVRSAQHF